jgi:osmotically-inducible protein OsmY
MMKRTATLLLMLFVAATLSAAQNNNTSASKKSKPAVDCSKTDDAAITASVQERLAKAASLKDFTINVATAGSVVTLTGGVKTGRNKGTATRVARSVPCVKKVDNQLMVETSSKAANKNSGM